LKMLGGGIGAGLSDAVISMVILGTATRRNTQDQLGQGNA